MTDIASRVRSVLARELGADLDQVTDQARLTTDLSADHIDIVNVTLELEDEFHVRVTDDDMEALEAGTVADVVALITRALQPTTAVA